MVELVKVSLHLVCYYAVYNTLPVWPLVRCWLLRLVSVGPLSLHVHLTNLYPFHTLFDLVKLLYFGTPFNCHVIQYQPLVCIPLKSLESYVRMILSSLVVLWSGTHDLLDAQHLKTPRALPIPYSLVCVGVLILSKYTKKGEANLCSRMKKEAALK